MGGEVHKVEERSRLALEVSRFGTWDYYPQSEVLDWCARCRELVEFDPHREIDYKTFLSTIHPEDRQLVERAASAAMSPGGGDYEVEYRLRGVRTGKEVWVVARGRVFFDASGSPVRFIGTAEDVTDKKSRQIRLEKAAEELKQANLELEEFASSVSHDLGEQLRTISVFLRLLSQNYRNKLAPEADEFIDFAVEGSKRLRKLVEALTQLASLSSRRLNLRCTEAALILDGVLHQLGAEIRRRGARVEAARLPAIWCDPGLIGLAFQNLIVNLIHFSVTRPPRLQISAFDKGEFWEFTLQGEDGAFGIPTTRSLLDLMVPSHGGELGPGVGLTVSKKILEKHGGTLWVETFPEDGRAFHFTLPKQPVRLEA